MVIYDVSYQIVMTSSYDMSYQIVMTSSSMLHMLFTFKEYYGNVEVFKDFN